MVLDLFMYIHVYMSMYLCIIVLCFHFSAVFILVPVVTACVLRVVSGRGLRLGHSITSLIGSQKVFISLVENTATSEEQVQHRALPLSVHTTLITKLAESQS